MSENSSVALHVLSLRHSVNKSSLNLVKNIVDRPQLNTYQNSDICKSQDLVNGDGVLSLYELFTWFLKIDYRHDW